MKEYSHNVNHVETNKILSSNAARTLRTRFERKPIAAENIVRKEKLRNNNRWV